MNRPTNMKLVAAIGGVVFALSAMIASAAGLGKLAVSSALGQPLSAEIELVSLQPGEFEALTARVASPEAYAEAKIEYVALLRQLRFSVTRSADGKPVLRITSNAAINEPFLDVLVEVSWPAGRLVREYPILLDPPGFDSARVTAPSVATVTPVAKPIGPRATPLPSTAPVAAGASTASDTYGPVKRGDTLSKIAGELKPEDVSMEQMLVALFRANDDAFVGGNMNRLRAGKILRMPSTDEIGSTTRSAAQNEIRVQVEDWKAYKNALAGAVAAAPVKPAVDKPVTGKIATATPVVPSAATKPDQLKLGRPDVGAKGGAIAGKGSAVDAANAAKEDAIAKQKALVEANSRIAELEKQKADARKLLEMKALPVPAKPPETKIAQATPPPAPPVPAPAASVVTPPAVADPAVVAEPKADAAKPVPAKVPPKVAPKAAPPPPEPDFIDTLMDNWPIIAGLGGLGVLGVGGFLFMRRRNKPSSSRFAPPSSLMPSDLAPNSVTGNKVGGLVDTGNSSFLTDFDKTGPGAIDTDEVDPVAEAEVYIAYGRDAQAEEILKEAMSRDKSRHEVSIKLLEIYHARKSAPAFENVARELKEAIGDSHPLWAKVATMGASIDAANKLYAGGATDYEATAAFKPGDTANLGTAATPMGQEPAKPDLDFDLGFGDAAPAMDVGIDLSSSTLGDAPQEAAMDFDLSMGSEPSPVADIFATSAAPAESGAGLDFDLAFESVSAPVEVRPASTEPAVAAKGDDSMGFDFDLSGLSLDAPSDAPSAPVEPSSAAMGGLNLADLSLDLDSDSGLSGGGESGDGAAATKLELAKAYIEIGDSDGAKEILNEVAREGSPQQQAEAKTLIAGL